jgi:alpha-D-xyloside xylohydrolase
VLPVGAHDDRPDRDHADGVTLHLVELPDGHRSTTRVPSGDGEAVFTVRRDGDEVRVTAAGTDAPWAVEPFGGRRVEVAAGTAEVVVSL